MEDEEDDDIRTQEAVKLDEDDLRIVPEVIKCILTFDYSKKPIKQADIMSCLTSKPGRKKWNQILTVAKEKLSTLGMTLTEVENKTAKAFMLVQNFEPIVPVNDIPKQERADRTLLILVLTFIFMKQELVEEVELWHYLNSLRILSDKKPVHDFFGDIKKKVLHQFVEQQYLVMKKVEGKDAHVISWGQRAHIEVSKKIVLEFVCQYGYGGKMKPEHWASHFQKINENQTKV